MSGTGHKHNGTAGKDVKPNPTKTVEYPWVETLEQFEALAEQRQRQTADDYQREAEYIGSLFLAIEGEAGPDDKFGLYSSKELIERLRPYLDMGNGWMAARGQTTPFVQLLETIFGDPSLQRNLFQRLSTLLEERIRPSDDSAQKSQQAPDQDGEPFLFLSDLNLQ